MTKIEQKKLQDFIDWLERRKLSPVKNPDEVMTMPKKKWAEDFDREIDEIIRKFQELFITPRRSQE